MRSDSHPVAAHIPVQLVVGPAANGVVEYGRDVALAISAVASATAGASGSAPAATTASTAAGASTWLSVRDADHAMQVAQRVGRVHLHIGDRVFGSSAEASADAVERLAAVAEVTLTLHDVPQVSDGPVNFGRRAAAFARMLAAARAVAVGSRYEAALLSRAVPGMPTPPRVIPLGSRERRVRCAAPETPPAQTVTIAGYFYPGKGHDEVLDALRTANERMPGESPTTLSGLGGVSTGHEGEYEQLRESARARGLRFEMTGYLARDDYVERLRTAAIPVAAHRHVSASRSILDWLDAGRRPLVPDGEYAHELLELRPDTIRVYAEADLAEAVLAAAANGGRTRLAVGHDLGYSIHDAARDYLLWWNDVWA